MDDTKMVYIDDNNSKEQPEATSNEKDLPDFKEITGYIYSSYMGDELISGVESLQEKYPSLKPFIYSSSVMSIIPLAVFAQSVLFIFSANVFVGTFAIYGYRKACNIPQIEKMGNYCYDKIYCAMSSKENTEVNSQENPDGIKDLKRIFTKVYDIMGDVNSSLKIAFSRENNDNETNEDSNKGFGVATVYNFFEPVVLMFKGKPSEKSNENKNNDKKSGYASPNKSSEKLNENDGDDKKSRYASSGTPSKSPVPEGLPPNESSPESGSYKKENDDQTASGSHQETNDNEDKESYDNEDKEQCCADKGSCEHTKKKELVTGTTNSIDKKDDAVEAAGLPEDDTKTSGVVDEPKATKDIDPVM